MHLPCTGVQLNASCRAQTNHGLVWYHCISPQRMAWCSHNPVELILVTPSPPRLMSPSRFTVPGNTQCNTQHGQQAAQHLAQVTHGADNTWCNTSPRSPHHPALNLVATTSPLTHMLLLKYCQYPTRIDTHTAHTHPHGHPHSAPSHARTKAQHTHTHTCTYTCTAHPHTHTYAHGAPSHTCTRAWHTCTCTHKGTVYLHMHIHPGIGRHSYPGDTHR